jgi:stearoyl-CoA desaturase (Delta-9 desaturase)
MVAIYAVRMFGITAGYHRYFSHRAYKLGRGWQFLMAFLAETSGQKGVLWWAAHHRVHHRHADGMSAIFIPL